MRRSTSSTGAAWHRSRALPWGMPSTMSTRTTSASSLAGIQWAQVAPTLPAPTMVTLLLRIMAGSSHVIDDGAGELGALHLGRAGHLPGEVVGDALLLDGPGHAGGDPPGDVVPAQVLEHHHAGEDERARVDLVLPGVLGRRAVGGLEDRRPIADVPSRGAAQAADRGGAG